MTTRHVGRHACHITMMKFGSANQSLPARSDQWVEPSPGHLEGEPPVDAPRCGDVLFEIGVILAVHLALAVAVTLLLRDCASC